MKARLFKGISRLLAIITMVLTVFDPRFLKIAGMVYLESRWPGFARRIDRLATNQAGNIVQTVIMVVLGILIVGTIVPALWPLAVDSLAEVAAMNGTDTGTTMIKTLWPVGVMIAAIGIGIWLIFYALKKLGVVGGGGGKKGW